MTDPVKYKKPRTFNLVVILLIAGAVVGSYLIYVFIPISMRKSEAIRVLDETSSTFTGAASRHLADKDVRKKLKRDMVSGLQGVGVDDPNAEFWIEVDSDDEVRFGVLYSDWMHFGFGIESKEVVRELEMFCSRPGRGSGWSCETRDLTLDGPPQDEIVDR